MSAPVPLIPESAPFSPAQRAWLNGFFAGLLSMKNNDAAPALNPATTPDVEETFPWHDPSIELDERMKLAEGKPLERVVMAAMAQLDCGTCGYLCKTYAEAIARGEDKDLSKCTPGGKPTAKKLRELMTGNVVVTSPKVDVTVNGTALASEPRAWSRSNPFAAKLIINRRLNGPASAKDTRLIGFDLTGSGLTYSVGDSLGVYAENCPQQVVRLLQLLGFDGTEPVGVGMGNAVPLFEAMLRHFSITKPSDAMLQLLADAATDEQHQRQLREMLDGDGAPDGTEIQDLLELFPSARPEVQAFAAAMSILQPRLYSISSSLAAHPNQVHLTVGAVRYTNPRGRSCHGVASTFVADRLLPGRAARIFVQPAHGFALPADPNTPIIMIGPGTGIAPFRAFLQHRAVTNATGRNWLFFGDQTADHDFLYRDEINAMLASGLLTRLDVAFSRDQTQKVYVQHRMFENAAEIWAWIQNGAHVYVCGDAKRMAKDVDDALKQIAVDVGRLSPEQAKQFLRQLVDDRRYQRDVY
jgi:sulfite reductase (NADPH) flavoprotein alpha-component